MNENNSLEKFRSLFGRAGKFGSFNDLKQPDQLFSEITSPPLENSQLTKEVGLGGISLVDRKDRIRITEFGPLKEPGCSSVDGFFDSSKIGQKLF